MKARIAHISDLHFGKISFSFSHLFSKRWLGTLNLLFSRRKHYLNSRPSTLFDAFKAHGVTHVIISGDLSTTSHPKEFAMAKEFVEEIEKMGIQVYLVPGNHDHYTKQSYKEKLFYSFFPEKYDPLCPLSLKTDGITYFHLAEDWWILLLDTALATSLYHSIGNFSHEIEKKLRFAFASIPEKAHILIVNHFPFFQHEPPRRRLKRGKDLENVLKEQPNAALYLHGHTHRHTLADLRESGLPLVMDSGSTSHKNHGSWNLLELTPHQCLLQVYSYDQHAPHNWKATHQKLYTW